MAGGKLASGIIEYAGANTPGWISNLGLTLSAGVLTVTDAQGGTLTPANPGWITVPSTTAGQVVTLKVTFGYSINDDAHASSDLAGLGFGITETVNWSEDMPFFIYVVNSGNSDLDGSDANSGFFLARDPTLGSTSSTEADIHDTAALSANDNQNSIILFKGAADLDNTDYEGLPCQLTGAIRMQWVTSTDDWTIQTLGNNDGLGEGALKKTFATAWTRPVAQNGAAAGSYFSVSGGNAPTYTATNSAIYWISSDGTVREEFAHENTTGGTAGTNSTNLTYHLAYASVAATAKPIYIGTCRVLDTGQVDTIASIKQTNASPNCVFQYPSTIITAFSTIIGTDQGEAARSVTNASVIYKAY